MKAIKVLNNSLILAEENGEEVILMGKGIGYQLSTGMPVDEQKIEKRFTQETPKEANRFVQLAADVDEVYFEITRELIQYAEETFGMELSSYLYVALSDHLSYAVQRNRDGIQFRTMEPAEIQKFYPHEWALGKRALQLIKEQLSVSLDADEVATIAMHFVNAQKENRYAEQVEQMNGMVKDILNIIKYHFQLIFQKEDVHYIRAVSHLQLFAQRVLQQQLLPNEKNDFLYTHIMKTCQPEAACVKKINTYLQVHYHVEMTNQEEMYLVLHIHRLLENQTASSKEE